MLSRTIFLNPSRQRLLGLLLVPRGTPSPSTLSSSPLSSLQLLRPLSTSIRLGDLEKDTSKHQGIQKVTPAFQDKLKEEAEAESSARLFGQDSKGKHQSKMQPGPNPDMMAEEHQKAAQTSDTADEMQTTGKDLDMRSTYGLGKDAKGQDVEAFGLEMLERVERRLQGKGDEVVEGGGRARGRGMGEKKPMQQGEEVVEEANYQLTGMRRKGRQLKEEVMEGGEEMKDKAIEMGGEAKESAREMKDKAVGKGQELKDKAVGKGQELKEEAVGKGQEMKNKAMDKGQEMKNKAMDKGQEMKNRVMDKGQEMKESVMEKGQEMKESVMGKGQEMKDKVAEQGQQVKEKTAQLKDKALDQGHELKEKVVERGEGMKEKVLEMRDKALDQGHEMREKAIELKDMALEKAEEMKEKVVEKAAELKEKVVGGKGGKSREVEEEWARGEAKEAARKMDEGHHKAKMVGLEHPLKQAKEGLTETVKEALTDINNNYGADKDLHKK